MHFHDLFKKYDQTLQCLIFLEKINLIHWNGRNTHILLTKLVVKVFLKFTHHMHVGQFRGRIEGFCA
jgi:hypothetical protein